MFKLAPGTRFWRTQLLGLCGLLLLLMGTVGPLLRHRIIDLPPSSPYHSRMPGQPQYSPRDPFSRHLPPPGFGFPGGMGFPFEFSMPTERIVVASLVTSPAPLHKVSGILLLLLGGALAFLVLRLQFEKLGLLAVGVSVFVFLVFVQSAYDLVARDNIHWRGYLPYYYGPNGGLIFGWAWLPLLASPILLWLAAREYEYPSEKERERLFAPKPKPVAPVSSPSAPQLQTASDVGLCAQCNSKNSLRATRCHACGSILPWETARLEKSKRTAQKTNVIQSRVSARKSNSRSIALNGLANFAIFVICFWLPFLSYFIWRHLDNEGSPYASAGFLGALSGALVFGGGFLLRLILTMAKVGLGAD